MKARIPLNSKQKKLLVEAAQEELGRKQYGFTRRLFKAFCYCLNRDFGFGKKRLEHLIGTVNQLLDEMLSDEAFWEHLDTVVIDELKIEFKREEVNEDGEAIQ